MKYAFAAVGVTALTLAQSISEVPDCARDCLTKAVTSKTNCAADDFSCICSNFDTIQGSVTSCVTSVCGTDAAINRILPAAVQLCKGVTSGGSKFSAPAAVAAQVSAPTTNAVVARYAATTIDTTITTTECPTTMVAAITAPANGSTPVATPTTPVTAGAATVGSLGAAVVMLALGALAL